MYDSRKLCAMKKTFETIHLAVACLALLLPLHLRAQQTGTVPECRSANCSLRGSQSAPSQGSSNSANRNQQIQNAIGAFGAAMEQSAKQQAERERRQAAEDARRQQLEQARQQEIERLQREFERKQAEQERKQQIDQQVKAALQQAQQDPSLNPFGQSPGGGASSANNASVGNSTSSADSSENLTGQSCRWLVVRDEETCNSRLCFYSEGQTVAWGSRAYRCDAGRWAMLRDCNQSTSDLRKNECLRDIVSIFGTPDSKEKAAPKIYQQD